MCVVCQVRIHRRPIADTTEISLSGDRVTLLIQPQTVTFCMSSFPGGAADVRFSLNGTTYQNNSVITLEDIGEGSQALLCITDQRNCCRNADSSMGVVFGNWFFPNETRVPSGDLNWNFYRTRGPSVVRLQRRRGGAEGLYRCEIPDTLNITQSIYIGVYNESNGEPLLTNYHDHITFEDYKIVKWYISVQKLLNCQISVCLACFC